MVRLSQAEKSGCKLNLNKEGKVMEQNKNTPFFFQFAIQLPENMELETNALGNDCVTWLVGGCDDD